jgi:hypothetical protein
MLSAAKATQDALEVRALSATFGVEILGINLSSPMADAFFDRIYEAFLGISSCCSANNISRPAIR